MLTSIKSADVDLLYMANMYRENGNLSKAKDILGKIENKDRHWKKLNSMVERKNYRVYKS